MHDLIAPLLTWQLAVAAVMVALAGLVRGFSGFGSALVLTPSLALLYGPEKAVPVVIVLETVWSVQMLRDGWRGAERREVGFLGLAAILAIPLTLTILGVMEQFEATRWLVVLARPATADQGEERDEAHSRLKDWWQNASETVKTEIGGGAKQAEEADERA